MQKRYSWSFLVAVFMALAAFNATAADSGRDPYKYFFDQTLGDFTEELKTAREQGKKGILIFFEMDECPFCHRMKETVLNQPEVQEYYRKHFLNFAVDVEGDVEIVDFEGKTMPQKDFAFKVNRVRATPVIAFYDLSGKPVTRYTGATSGVDEFLWLGEFVAEGHHKDMPFTKYKRQKSEAKPQ